MKKLFSIVLAFCLFAATSLPAKAVEEKTNLISSVNNVSSEVELQFARIIVNSGVKSFVNKITVYPAIYDKTTKQVSYHPDVVYYERASGNSQTGSIRLTPTQTQTLLSQFKTTTGLTANAWIMQVDFSIYSDGKGSYGEYYKYTPRGTSLHELDNGRITYTLARNTGNYGVYLQHAYLIPEDTSTPYSIGLEGGFYFYSASTRTTLNWMSNANVYFNDPA